ncbi:MAG: HIRAN domain-containing protein [Saccharofermentans sp.]|nr:HIRAN domain-containing protein [Saccharofermentans sp.]
MSNELTNIDGKNQIAQTILNNGVTDIIKPLVKEIFLFDTFIAGTTYVDKEVIAGLKPGDALILQREKDNKFDDRAVLVLTSDKKKAGYIPEKDNVIFSRLMDAGKLLTAKINSIDKKGDFSKVKIDIYLTDF